jgi:hypothetical protein
MEIQKRSCTVHRLWFWEFLWLSALRTVTVLQLREPGHFWSPQCLAVNAWGGSGFAGSVWWWLWTKNPRPYYSYNFKPICIFLCLCYFSPSFLFECILCPKVGPRAGVNSLLIKAFFLPDLSSTLYEFYPKLASNSIAHYFTKLNVAKKCSFIHPWTPVVFVSSLSSNKLVKC